MMVTQFTVISNEQIVNIFQIDRRLRYRCKDVIEAHEAVSDSTEIIIDVSDYHVPNNLEALLNRRRPRIIPGDTEEEDYTTHADVLKLFGSHLPVPVDRYVTGTVTPRSFKGIYTIPDDVDIFVANVFRGLTGVVAGLNVTSITMMSSGASGIMDIPNGLHDMCINQNKGIIDISGGKYINVLEARDTGLRGIIHIIDGARAVFINENPDLIGFTGGEGALLIDVRDSGYTGDLCAPQGVKLIAVNGSPGITSYSGDTNTVIIGRDDTVTNVNRSVGNRGIHATAYGVGIGSFIPKETDPAYTTIEEEINPLRGDSYQYRTSIMPSNVCQDDEELDRMAALTDILDPGLQDNINRIGRLLLQEGQQQEGQQQEGQQRQCPVQ